MYDHNATKTGRRGIHRGQTFLFTRKGFKCEKKNSSVIRRRKISQRSESAGLSLRFQVRECKINAVLFNPKTPIPVSV